jgi:RHS repeat-associated protein
MDVLPTGGGTVRLLGTAGIDTFNRGNKFFELSNHLQNVLVTISDKKIGVDADNNGQIDYYTADVTSAQDFYPFGFKMPGRQWSNGSYRYGFNGKEEDDEVKGDGNQLDYKMRIYDPRLGRFLSVDAIADEYPQLTPYQFASNQPIESVDMDGLERMDYRAIKGDDGKAKLTLVSEGPKEWKGTLLGFTINKVTIPHHIRVEYNGQHYVFDDGGRNSLVTNLPEASGYGQYPDAVHYASDYDKFLANPDEFVKTHRSEEKEVKEWDNALAKVEIVVNVAEAVADGVSSGRGGRGRSPRMPKIKTPKPSTSANKPAMQQKVVATPNTTVKQKAAAQQKAIVKPTSRKPPEFERGQTTETGFLNSAMNWLREGYKDMGSGRYLSADGLRQVRYGNHETDPRKRHHGHFESYDKPADKGGVVTETATVEIVPDKKN